MYDAKIDISFNAINNGKKAMLLDSELYKNTDKQKLIGEGVKFERIRRITGYLVGSLDRFNNAKRAEEHDRIKHGV